MTPLESSADFMPRETVQTLIFIVFAAIVSLVAIQARVGPELADDGAFFLRYAENMARGELWKWNPGEPPIWGASAPIFPLTISFAILLGTPPAAAIAATSAAFALVACTIAALLVRRLVGGAAGVAFLALIGLDTGLTYFFASGLETPLTCLLIALGLWAVLERNQGLFLGLVAGALAVHKLDLVPAALLLLGGAWLQTSHFPRRSFVVAFAVASAWYLGAWAYFGSPLPNSFLTKLLHQNHLTQITPNGWFVNFVFLEGPHKWLVVAAMASIAAWRTIGIGALLFLLGLPVIHALAYSLKPPFEPYGWYAMPSVFCLTILASLGLGVLGNQLANRLQKLAGVIRIALPSLAAVALLFTYLPGQLAGARHIAFVSGHLEKDRADAGRWVSMNTPQDFKLFSAWGNPSYYSNRYVLDGSFLNRKFESGSLIEKYRPELLILQSHEGMSPADPFFPEARGYVPVKTFDSGFRASLKYFFVVLARADVAEQVVRAELLPSRKYVISAVKLGDKFGRLEPKGDDFYVHPGATSPTELDLSTAALLAGQGAVRLLARIDHAVPPEAVQRGAANLRVRVLKNGVLFREKNVSPSTGALFTLDVEGGDAYRIVIDNFDGPDTDWLLLTFLK